MILVIGGNSFVVVFMLMAVLGFGIIIGAAFGLIILMMSTVLVFYQLLRRGHVLTRHLESFYLHSGRW